MNCRRDAETQRDARRPFGPGSKKKDVIKREREKEVSLDYVLLLAAERRAKPGDARPQLCASAPLRRFQARRFDERSVASVNTVSPHASSARACGQRISRPIPFRKMPRTMIRK